MKKIAIYLCIACSFCAFAQQSEKPTSYEDSSSKVDFSVYVYQIDQDVLVDIKNATPNGDMAFYSKSNGGEILNKYLTDDKGSLNVSFRAIEQAAFVLSDPNNGTGEVEHFKKKQFHLNDVYFNHQSSKGKLSFNSKTVLDKDLIYQVIAKDHMGNESVVEAIAPYEIGTWEYHQMSFDIESSYQYKFVAISSGIERYAEVLNDGAYNIKLYPSITDELLHINFGTAVNNAAYQIYNINGQLVEKGKFNESYNTIQVASLPKGNYIISISDRANTVEHFYFSKK